MKPNNFINLARSHLISKRLGAFEIFYLERDHLLADSKGGRVESLEEATEAGLAVRVVDDHRLGFSYVTSLDRGRIEDCIDNAIAASREVEPDDAWSFALPKPVKVFDWKYNDEKLGKIPVSKKAENAVRLEAEALRVDPLIKKVRKSLYEESRIKTCLINSEGVDLTFEKTLVSCHIIAVAESDGDSQWAWDFGFSHTFDGLDVKKVAHNAATDAISLIGAKKIPTMKVRATLAPFVVVQFLKTLAKGFYGDNIYKKKSSLVGRLNQGPFSKSLTLVDNGLREDGYGSFPFDAEGEPCKKTYLVRNGLIKNWLTDIYWGKKLGVSSTGSSSRDSLKGMPSIGGANIYIEPAKLSREGLINQMEKGFYITGVIGAHTVNPITGDFSVGAEGQWVERGRVKYPVKGVVIAGNLNDLFNNLTAVADDLRFMGGIGSPTVLISDLQVSG